MKTSASSAETAAQTVPFDEHLLDRAQTQWQFGDWEGLQSIEREQIQHHPDRARLALLAGAARLQAAADAGSAVPFLHLARDWGCPPRLVAQVLIAGVYDALGRATFASGREQRALACFADAARIGAPGSATALLGKARAEHQVQRLTERLGMRGVERIAAVTPPSSPAATVAAWSAERLQAQVSACFADEDVLAQIDARMADPAFDDAARLDFLATVADEFALRGDTLTAQSFITSAQEFLPPGDEAGRARLARRLATLGARDAALDLLVNHALDHPELGERERDILSHAYSNARRLMTAQGEHGHDLLLMHLKSQWPSLRKALGARRGVLIEIGSTREHVAGQGSTRKLAECCRELGLHMISVDMDPHNTAGAAATFRALNVDFEAVTSKGEDYLREFAGPIDFAFLDAYDFDHGRHSELRQSRYRKFLGAPIDDAACHAMHLDCAQSLAQRLSPAGLICVDDTWLEGGRWTAKGTTALPYLLGQGFELVEARNRAALLRRAHPAQAGVVEPRS